MSDQSIRKRLVVGGLILILVGLLTGFVIQRAVNPRVAMASHVEALMGGMLLILTGGVVWEYTHFGKRTSKIVMLLLLYATYANWFFLLLSAAWGTGMLLPIAANGFKGTPLQETITRLGMISSAFAILGAVITLIVGIVIEPKKS